MGRGVLVLNSHLRQIAPHRAYDGQRSASEFSHASKCGRGDLIADKQRTGRLRKLLAEANYLVSRTAWTCDAFKKRIRWDTRLIASGRCLLVTPLIGRPRHSVATCDHLWGTIFAAQLGPTIEIMKPVARRNQIRGPSTTVDRGAVLRDLLESSSIEQI